MFSYGLMCQKEGGGNGEKERNLLIFSWFIMIVVPSDLCRLLSIWLALMITGYMMDFWGINFFVMSCIICLMIQHYGMYLSKVMMCCLC